MRTIQVRSGRGTRALRSKRQYLKQGNPASNDLQVCVKFADFQTLSCSIREWHSKNKIKIEQFEREQKIIRILEGDPSYSAC